jgi:hypothetical protein
MASLWVRTGLIPTAATGIDDCLMFKEEIRSLLMRRFKIRWLGGEVSASQLEKANEELRARGEQPSVTTPETPKLPSNLTFTPEQVKTVVEAFDAERARATLWEYRYLNCFFARDTQRVLDWLASLDTRTTSPMFDSFWLPLIPRAEERRTIINVLEAHNLIALRGEVIEVTPKGHDYLRWRGPLPDAWDVTRTGSSVATSSAAGVAADGKPPPAG